MRSDATQLSGFDVWDQDVFLPPALGVTQLQATRALPSSRLAQLAVAHMRLERGRPQGAAPHGAVCKRGLRARTPVQRTCGGEEPLIDT